MQLYDIISNLKFIGIKNYKEVDIEALTCSSTEKVENGIFFCINGIKNDGHDYAEESIKNGAICLIVERFLNINITQIMVEDVRVAMSYISAIFYGTYKSRMSFVGITGTNGKTTTTFLIKDILRNLGCKVGLIGTQGVFINSLILPASLTTPDPIDLHKLISDMERNECEYCIMEVSAHAIALNKIDNIYYDCVGLTNITKDHLDFFINMENYVNCKSTLFTPMHAKRGVVDISNKYCKEIVKNCHLDILTIGKDADFAVTNVNQSILGTDFKFSYKNTEYSCHTNLLGEYNVSNLMMAISVLVSLNFELDEVLKVINTTKFYIPGRFNMLKLNANFNVLVDYAHTPDGIKNVLSTIKKLPINKLITVFGCGGDRDKTKRAEMGQVATSLSDKVIITSDNPRSENPEVIIDDIVRDNKAKNFVRITDRKMAIEYALSIAKENDLVAILGKGAETYQEIDGVKYKFSDYDVVDEYFKQTKMEEVKYD